MLRTTAAAIHKRKDQLRRVWRTSICSTAQYGKKRLIFSGLVGAGKSTGFLFLDQVQERLLRLLTHAADADDVHLMIGQRHEDVGQYGGVNRFIVEPKLQPALA